MSRTDEALFLQEIAENPHNWFPRLVFADWLEEQGDPRSELIRLSHALTRFDCDHRVEQEARLQQLREAGVPWPTPQLPNSLGMKFVLIPPGEFLMGSPESELCHDDNEDQVKVTLTKGFWLGQYEVTQGEWQKLMETTPWKVFVKEGSGYPASRVSWDDAMQFCGMLTEQERKATRLQTGWAFTLPTEAQWEYACRAGTTTMYSFGDDRSKLSEYAWFDENTEDIGEDYAHVVGQKKPNAWNLSDMHGNLWEWCRDWYPNILPGGIDPEVTERGRRPFRSYRGGCWNYFGGNCRSAVRNYSSPGSTISDLGFRVAVVQTES